MISQAIQNLRPGSQFNVICGDDMQVSRIEWLDEKVSAPSEVEINAEIARLQAEYQAKQYQRDRAAEYPSFADQFDTLYHGGYDAWKAQIDAIKLKYPKP
jgi:uncharacterized small protein (DUF1192 family)